MRGVEDGKVVSSDNYVYQGEWLANEKNGEGMMMLKNGMMILGTWQKDYLNGPAVVFPPFGGIIRTNFIAGRLNGWAVSSFSDKVVTFTLYFEGKIDG